MFPSFNGSSRKPRNVNLGGRKSVAPPRASLINAQQERAQRDKERRRLKAAITIQRVWRGRKAIALQRAHWRREWDQLFSGRSKGSWVKGIALFLAFYQRGFGKLQRGEDPRDLERINILIFSITEAIQKGDDMFEGNQERSWYLLRQFSRLLVGALGEGSVRDHALGLLPWLAQRLPELVDARYYQALSRVTTSSSALPEAVLPAVLTPLRSKGSNMEWSYRVFSANYLVTPELPERLGTSGFETLRTGVDIVKLFKAMEVMPGAWIGVETEGRLWLLSYIVDFLLTPPGNKMVIDLTGDEYLEFNKGVEEQRVLSLLLASVSGEVGKRINIEDVLMDNEDDSDDEDSTDTKASFSKKQPLPPFVKSRLHGLIQQSSVSTVFSQTNYSDRIDAKILAGFALTLLLVFPARRQEVRMWLCLAETKDGASAVRFLWEAVKRTSLYTGITRDYNVAVESLKRRTSSGSSQTEDDEEWNLILLFVELYGFLLIVMDDDEFFSGGVGGKKERQLPLNEVGEMSVFLKNMAFAMYWSGGEIIGEDKSKSTGGEVYFKDQNSKGWGAEYLRERVTALLKLVYTRDSRRRFLRKGHWLMTDRFNMEGFIASVVQEEESRHQIENDDEEEPEEENERQLDRDALAAMNPHERRNLVLEQRKRNQRKQQRNHYLATITPRLEILKHLPFFIPFATRVQIFRQFVLVDQKRRRGGFIDPDQWRAAVLSRSGHGAFPRHDGSLDGHDRLSRHHATIRRNRVFEDAYKQFWPLGEGLKEPIQITFVDQFGTEEAGIDGGGVTKEFLTGVCGEAFTPTTSTNTNTEAHTGNDELDISTEETGSPASLALGTRLGQNLFLENDQHLLYPNPTSVEELKEELGMMSYPEEVEEGIRRLLRRYEFLGRVVGKCLYEGILVDVAFAGFFLLRWSQLAGDKLGGTTAGIGVNDLRDLDEDLYRGLVNLKNYKNGDVETDFALNFTITSRLPKSENTITVELKPGGEKIPVTNANRLEYIHLVSRYRLSVQAQAQTAAFLKGINSIIKPSWLSMFNQTELQTLVGGDINTPIDVEDLRKNTIYGGVYQIGDDGMEHPSVKLFWEVMKELGDEERRKVLKFVTSVARAPLLGFGVLRPRFSIRDAGEDQARLCSASTCVNLLKMPRYKDPKILKEKLLYSVNSNAGFDLS